MFSTTSNKYNIPLDHMDFNYISSCENVQELENILKVLRSRKEGFYPELEHHCEKRLFKLSPNSRVLRKEQSLLSSSDLSKEEQLSLQDDLDNWHKAMNDLDSSLRKSDDLCNEIVDNSSIPIRKYQQCDGNKDGSGDARPQPAKCAKPRTFEEWDKLNVDEELEKIDLTESSKVKSEMKEENKVYSKDFSDTRHLADAEKSFRANNEKDKGNEAFKAGDYEEAILYYSSSISLQPSLHSYNNRALSYLRLRRWTETIQDCNLVLEQDPDNIKALMRRSTAFKELKDFHSASVDINQVLVLEPSNKKAQNLLAEIDQEKLKCQEAGGKKSGSRRLVIEEVEGDESDEGDSTHRNSQSSSITDVVDKSKEEMENNENERRRTLLEKNSKNIEINQNQNDVNDDASDGLDKICEKSKKDLESDQTTLVDTTTNQCNSSNTVLDDSPREQSGVESCADDTEKSSTCFNDHSTKQDIDRPVFHKQPLHQLHTAANQVFRSGQYSEAICQYSHAINELKEKSDYQVNLSLLHTNRATCYLKIGDPSSAIYDCTAALEYLPHSVKPLLRRATACEQLERYGDAFSDYKHVQMIDPSVVLAFQGATRCQSMLSDKHGRAWRQKIKPLPALKRNEVPIVIEPEQDPQQQIATPSDKPTCESSPEELFDKWKSEGNDLVKKGSYDSAITCYTHCSNLFPDRSVSYTNRAHCFLKLSKNEDAINDCTKALELDSSNVKALFRRSQARKYLKLYKECLSDLTRLLKTQPQNSAALKEIKEVKELWRIELEKLKKSGGGLKLKTEKQLEERRVPITEVTGSDSDEGEESSDNLTKIKRAKSPPKANKSVPASVPILSRINPYEFMSTWNSLKAANGTELHSKLLKQISPEILPKMLTNKLDGDILTKIIFSISDHLLPEGEFDFSYQILLNVGKVQRFSTVVKFLSNHEKLVVEEIIGKLKLRESSKYSTEDIDNLKFLFSL